MDQHGAARSGQQRESLLREMYERQGYTFIRTQKDAAIYLGYELTPKGNVRNKDKSAINEWMEGRLHFTCRDEYAESGFSYFESDGFVVEQDAILELKGGRSEGTTEEKIFFDLDKIQHGAYGSRPLIYVFEGTNEDNKCTKLFRHRLNELHQKGECLNVSTVCFSDGVTG